MPHASACLQQGGHRRVSSAHGRKRISTGALCVHSAVLAAAAAPARHAQAAPEAPIAAHSPGRVRVRASTSKSLAVIIPHRERHVYCWECLTSAHLDMRGTTFACPFGLAATSPSLIVALRFPRAHTAPAAAQPLSRACRACRSLLEALWLRRLGRVTVNFFVGLWIILERQGPEFHGTAVPSDELFFVREF